MYIDKTVFRLFLALGNEDHIYLMLVDRLGEVLWQARGAYQPEIAETRLQAVDKILTPHIKVVEI